MLAGEPFADPPVYGTAYEQFGGGDAGRAACEAISSLIGVGAVDTMLSNFIKPLQENADADSRIHCSLNLNTETGRLSSRSPNLQNQPGALSSPRRPSRPRSRRARASRRRPALHTPLAALHTRRRRRLPWHARSE